MSVSPYSAALARRIARSLRDPAVASIDVQPGFADADDIVVVCHDVTQLRGSSVRALGYWRAQFEDAEWGAVNIVLADRWSESGGQARYLAADHTDAVLVPIDPEEPDMAGVIVGDVQATKATPTAAADGRTVAGAKALVKRAWEAWQMDPSKVSVELARVMQSALDRVQALATSDPYLVYRAAFDEAVNLGTQPYTDKLTDWANTRVEKLGTLPGVKMLPHWLNAGFDPVKTPVAQRPPASWFARQVAFFLVGEGNADVARDPTLAPAMLACAKAILASRWASDESTFDVSNLGNFYGWVLTEALPPQATDTARWIKLGAKTAGYTAPSTWDAVREVTKRTIEDIKDNLVPEGGFGPVIGAAVLVAAGVAAWRVTSK